jgi:hypothetical protein
LDEGQLEHDIMRDKVPYGPEEYIKGPEMAKMFVAYA